MTLAADAPTTDGRENPATDTSRIVHSQDQKTYKSNLNPQPDAFPKIASTLGATQRTTGAEARYRKSGWSCTVR